MTEMITNIEAVEEEDQDQIQISVMIDMTGAIVTVEVTLGIGNLTGIITTILYKLILRGRQSRLSISSASQFATTKSTSTQNYWRSYVACPSLDNNK